MGATYPRLGLEPTEERIEELKSSNNKQGVPLIEEVAKMPFSDEDVTDADKADAENADNAKAEDTKEEKKEQPKKRGRKKG